MPDFFLVKIPIKSLDLFLLNVINIGTDTKMGETEEQTN